MTGSGATANGSILADQADRLAALCTENLYQEKPALMDLGERGRDHTRADFGYHFLALADLSEVRFAEHVSYCVGLFKARGFPLVWLEDAWRHMAKVIVAETPLEVSGPALEVMRGVGLRID
ncbi:MAG: hypothetical protein NVSMB17_09400 [Candidatus Dormibacteria bacterium]